MGTATTPRETRKKRWEVSLDGVSLFSLDDIIAVNQHTAEIRHMKVPENAPEVKGVTVSALPDHVTKCQQDIKQWDDVNNGVLVSMSKLAGSLQSFCLDSLEALDQLDEISRRIQTTFDTLTEQQKENLRGDMNDIFSSLLETSTAKEKESQAMATRLAKFAELLEKDGVTAEDLRAKYQDHIEKQQLKIEEWETTKGLTPSGDLVKDLNKRIDEINEIIRTKEAEYIAASAGAGTSGALSLVPFFWIISIPGVIIGSVFAGIRDDELKDLRTEIQEFLDKLGESRHLNTLKIWFDSHKKTFDDLTSHLRGSQHAVENLRGQWQTFTNNLTELTGDTGKLKGLKKDDWLEPLSKFKMKTTRSVYDRAGHDISFFQKNAFRSQMEIEVLQPKAA
jgi:hypothetical protein